MDIFEHGYPLFTIGHNMIITLDSSDCHLRIQGMKIYLNFKFSVRSTFRQYRWRQTATSAMAATTKRRESKTIGIAISVSIMFKM